MRLQIDQKQKEVKAHGTYGFPVLVSPERLSWFDTGEFPWHWHPEIELTWFVSGQMEYVVNDQRYIISEGEGIFCNSNALHAGYMIDDQDCNYISVTFHPKFIQDVMETQQTVVICQSLSIHDFCMGTTIV